MTQPCDEIKALIVDILRRLGPASDEVKLIAILQAVGVTDVAEIARLSGIPELYVRGALVHLHTTEDHNA